MEIEVFVLCDAATQWGGKLNILGAFDTIHSPQFPAIHPHCAIALRIRFDRIEEGEHRVRISLVDADGTAVIPGLDGTVKVKPGPQVPSVCANMVLNLARLQFKEPGFYSLDLAIDGRHERSIPVRLVQAPKQPPPTGPEPSAQ